MKLKKIVKKLKNEVSKNALSDLKIHAVISPVDDKIKDTKIKDKPKKTKKPKGEPLDGKKEETGKENKEEFTELSRGNEKTGRHTKAGGSIWPWEWN